MSDPTPPTFPGPIDPPQLTVPLPPPEVGEGSPWAPADGENRDRILDWWRAWWRRIFFPWLAAFLAWLNAWLAAAEQYILIHAVAGYSWRTTTTAIAPTGLTTVTLIPIDDLHPVRLGDFVADQTAAKRYGIVTALVDGQPNQAIVTPLGILSGLPGYSWWTTATPINAAGPTTVVLAVDPTRSPQVNDLVSDTSSYLRYGVVTAVVDQTHVTVSPLGQIRGLAGFGWWTTSTVIAQTGTTPVVIAPAGDRTVELNDLVVDDSDAASYGEVVSIQDATHVTVAYVGQLRGPAGIADLGVFDYTTAPLAPQGVYQGQMAIPQMVGAFGVSVDHPAWVRVYSSQAHMLADATRSPGTPIDISLDHGCFLDFVANATELSKTLTPGVQLTDVGSGLWLSITNFDTVADSIHAHFDFRVFRD